MYTSTRNQGGYFAKGRALSDNRTQTTIKSSGRRRRRMIAWEAEATSMCVQCHRGVTITKAGRPRKHTMDGRSVDNFGIPCIQD